MVLNPALHSAAGHVGEIGGKHTGSNSSVRDKDISQKQSGSGSENDKCNSQATMKAAPAQRQPKSKKKHISKDHVSHAKEKVYHFNEINHIMKQIKTEKLKTLKSMENIMTYFEKDLSFQ